MRIKLKALAVLLLVCFAPATWALPSEIVVGFPTPEPADNCFPFGCFPFGPSGRYQQVYDASSFTRPFNIRQLVFYVYKPYDIPAFSDRVIDGTFEIYLSVTDKGVNEIDGVAFDENLGSNTRLFASFLGGKDLAGQDEWVISGTPFLYRPSMGNLLLDVRYLGIPEQPPPQQGATIAFYARNGNADGLFSRWQNYGDGFDDFGLVTGFRTSVPEPGSLVLFGLGLAGLGLIRRRKAA